MDQQFLKTSNMTSYIYIHGFGTTGAGSNKFKKIKIHAEAQGHQAYALEWNEHQKNIVENLELQLENYLQHGQKVVVVGSSTGGNFTLQLLPFLKKKKIEMRYILINPLIDVKQRKIDNLNFTQNLALQLRPPSEDAKNGLLILGKNDEVLDYQFTKNALEKTHEVILSDVWNHSLSNISDEQFIELIFS